MVLVDTTIWSLALRRRTTGLRHRDKELVDAWTTLVTDGSAALIGPVRQEILSGIKRVEVFEFLRQRLSDFAYLPIEPADYDQAAAFFNVCRESGVAATSIDMLICAVAHKQSVQVFTTDRDFDRYANHLPVRLYEAA